MQDSWQSFLRLQCDLNGFRPHLLTRQENRLLDCRVQIRRMKFRWPWPRINEQIVQDRLNVLNFAVNLRQHRAAGTLRRQFPSHHFDDPGNSSKRIANFVRQSCRQLSDRGEMFGARHFPLVQPLDFRTIFLELPNHFIELLTQLPDVVVTLGEIDPCGQITFAYPTDDPL